MCGRFTLVTEKRVLELLFEIELMEEITSRYNIAPSEMLLALRCSPHSGQKELIRLQWGLVPFWAINKFTGGGLITIRAVPAAVKFSHAFRWRRVLIAAIHHRMPLIIPEELYPLWLDPGTPTTELQKMLLPYPAEKMDVYPVSKLVNNPAFDHPDCLRKE